MDENRRLLLRRAALAIAGLLAVSVVVWLVGRMDNGHPTAERLVPKVVTLKIEPPPLPPPPPPPQKLPEEKMVEQPKIREPMIKPDKVVEQPKSTLRAPPGPLALDAKGEGAPDAFGLGGNPGGGDASGGGGGEGTRFGWYAAMVQSQIQTALRKDDKLRGAHYRIALRLWLDPNGGPAQVELINSTGEQDLDVTLKRALLAMPRLSEVPPRGMPEPIILRIDSRRG